MHQRATEAKKTGGSRIPEREEPRMNGPACANMLTLGALAEPEDKSGLKRWALPGQRCHWDSLMKWTNSSKYTNYYSSSNMK